MNHPQQGSPKTLFEAKTEHDDFPIHEFLTISNDLLALQYDPIK